MTPTVSVIMAVRDGERYLDDAMRSIVGQTWDHFEAVVVDDGSTDRTPQLLDNWKDKDARIRVVRQAATGLAPSLNRAATLARGTFLARHDADDLSMPDRLARQLSHLFAHPSLAAVGAPADIIDADGVVIGKRRVPQDAAAVRRALVKARVTPIHGAVTMRRAAFEAVGGYREAFAVSQDFDLWLRMVERFDLDNVPETLYQVRYHAESVSAKRRPLQLASVAVMLTFAEERRRHGGDSYATFAAGGADLERFVEDYRLRGLLEARWGELLVRGLGRPREGGRHFWRAIRHGHVTPWTLALCLWTSLGLPWPRWPARRWS